MFIKKYPPRNRVKLQLLGNYLKYRLWFQKITLEEIAIGYGKFLEATIDFFIIALTVFMVVKVMNKLKNKAEDVEDKTVTTPKNIELLTKMTELMEKQNELLSDKKS